MRDYNSENSSRHRPWTVPENGPTWSQNWNDALFLHWPVSSELIRNLIPSTLEPDLFEGTAWVSIVAFTMENVEHKYLPVPKCISEFHELNVRTYVTSGNYSGVFFLSIEACHHLGAPLSRWMSGMPYRYAEISRSEEVFKASSFGKFERFKCRFSPGYPLAKGTAGLWFTERYALFRMKYGSLLRQEIDHGEWPLFELKIHDVCVDMPQFGLAD
jgi:uncharacterized protein